MKRIHYSIYLLMLLLFGNTLFAECVYIPSNDFRTFGRPPKDNPWEELSPENEPPPCRRCCLANQIEVGAEALYWQSSYGGVEYGINTANTPNFRPLLINSSWQWGYRVNARLKSCSENLYLKGDYLNFSQQNNKTSFGTIISVFTDNPGQVASSATARIENAYETADLFVGYRWLNGFCLESSIFAGGRYFKIRSSEHFRYTLSGGISDVVQKCRLRGGGPRIGLDMTYRPFACGWLGGLGVRGMVAQLAGIGWQIQRYDNTLPQLIITEGFQRFPTSQHLLLNTDVRLEAFYRMGVCCVKLQVNGGYEFNFYSTGCSHITSAGSIAFETNQRESIGFGGPFVGLNLFW